MTANKTAIVNEIAAAFSLADEAAKAAYFLAKAINTRYPIPMPTAETCSLINENRHTL